MNQGQTTIPAPVPVINVKKIDKVLKADAKAMKLISGEFACLLGAGEPTCKNVGRCANGALLIAAGYPVAQLVRDDQQGRVELGAGGTAARLLEKAYGLLPVHTSAIIGVNDGTEGERGEQQMERYEEVMALVTFADVAQENGIRFGSPSSLEWAYENGF